MKAIAIDVRCIGRGRTGDEAVFRGLTRALLAIDTDNRYLLLTDREEAREVVLDAVGGRGKSNCEVIALPLGGNKFSWNLIAAPLFLIRHRIDVFHTQYILPWFIPRRTRVAAHIHDVSFHAFPEFIGSADRFFLSFFIPKTIRRADIVIAPSRFTGEEIAKRYGASREKIAIVPNALSLEHTSEPSDVELVRVRQKYRLPDHFLLVVGTLQPRKNIPFLIRAFSRFHDRVGGVGLVLTGDRKAHHFDRDIDSAIEEVNLRSFIHFPGYIASEDLPALYRLASGLVIPSRYEGFGLPLLEAFSREVPVAASDIPPFREVAGDAAVFFSPEDIAECAESLYTLFTDETVRRQCKERGRKRLLGYSWEESARILLSRY